MERRYIRVPLITLVRSRRPRPQELLLTDDIAEGTTPVTVNLGTGFQYLVVAYDGPNGGVAVFNVAGLTGSVDLYRYAKPSWRERQSSGKQCCSTGLLQDDRLDATQPNRRS